MSEDLFWTLNPKRLHPYIEADKMKCKYQSQANAVAMEKAMRAESDAKHKSFWGKLGDRIIGGIDFVGDKVSSLEWND